MFCGLIRIQLMVFTLIIFFYYCELIDPTTPKHDLENKVKEMNNLNRFKRRNYYEQPKTQDRDLKEKLNKELLLKNSIQLLQDDTKAQILKLRNSYLENFADSDKKNKQEKNSRAAHQNPADKIWRRNLDDTTETSDDDNNDDDDDPDNQNPDKYAYKQGTNNRLLEEIVKDLDQIRDTNVVGKGKGEDCVLNGTWISDVAGVSFNITLPQPPPANNSCDGGRRKYESSTLSSTTKKPFNADAIGDVTINAIEVERTGSDLDRPPLLNCSWSIAARIPFSRSTMLIITAEFKPTRAVAVFVGQCRYCDRAELVVGQWLVQKYALGCRRIQLTQDVYGDVFRRPPTCSCSGDQ